MGFKKNAPGCQCCEGGCCPLCKDELDITFFDGAGTPAEIGSAILAKSCGPAPLAQACGAPHNDGWRGTNLPCPLVLFGSDAADANAYCSGGVVYYFSGIVSDVFSGSACGFDNLQIELHWCGDEKWAGFAHAWIPDATISTPCNAGFDPKCPCFLPNCQCRTTGALWFKGTAAAPQDDCDVIGDTTFNGDRVAVTEAGINFAFVEGVGGRSYYCNCFEADTWNGGNQAACEGLGFVDLDFNAVEIDVVP